MLLKNSFCNFLHCFRVVFALALLWLMLPQQVLAQAGAPFTCDVVFYQMRNQNTGTGSLLIKFAAVSNSVTPTAATPAVNTTIEINAIGYNPVDNYIYGIRADSATNTLYRIGQSGYELVGTLTQTVPSGLSLAGFVPTAGVFDAAGRYYVAGQGGTPNNITPAAIFRVDSIPATGAVNVVHQYSNTPTAVTNYGDFDFNGAGGPNGLLLAATGGNLYRINLTANASTPGIGTASHSIVPFVAGSTTTVSVGGVGSAFYDAFTSRFYVFDNTGNRFWQIVNPEVGSPSLIDTNAATYPGPPTFNPVGGFSPTDGTSCPISGTRVTDLQILKTDGNTTVTTNQVVAYNITVGNSGPYPANYSVVADPAQPGVQKLSVTCSAIGGPPSAVCPPGLTTATFQAGVTINTFPPGTSLQFTLNALITPTVGPVTNVATVTPAIDTTDSNPSNNRATDTNAISGNAPAVISSASICPAGTVESPVNLISNGNFSAAAPFSTDAQITGTQNTLQANANVVRTFVARQNGQRTYAGFGSPSSFTVLQNPFPGDPGRSVIGGSDWLIANGKFNVGPDPVSMWQQPVSNLIAGRTYQAMFYVSNAAQPGQTPALLPSVRPQVITTTSSFITATLTLANETIATDDQWRLVQGTFIPAANGTVTLSIADLTTPSPNETGGVWALSGITLRECTPAADVRVSKTNNVTSLSTGGTTQYTITLSNPTAVTATTLTFSDPAVSNFIKFTVTCTASAGSLCPAPATATTVLSVETTGVTVPRVAPNSTVTFIIRGTVTGAAGTTVTNIASIVPIGYIDTDPTNDSAQDSDPVTGSVFLSITKTNSVTTLTAGLTTSYIVTVTNSGSATVNNALFKDTPSAGLSCTSIFCTANGAALCPLPANLTIANMTGSGIQIPSLPAPPTSSVQFTINCNVTATGRP
jgi:uncharacterized repeat protein (TIGR01451 family)